MCFSMLPLFIVLYFDNAMGIVSSTEPIQSTWLTTLLSDYNHHQIDIVESTDNNKSTLIQDLSLDLWTLIIGHLQRKDIHSLLRSNRHNMHCCRQFIRNLLGIKFSSLLSHPSSDINVKHLMNIPLVDPICINASDVPNYFKNGQGQSKLIGIDSKTGNGFVSFWMKQVKFLEPETKILSILFNETGVYCLYLSESSYPLSFVFPSKMYKINVSSDPKDMEVISTILLKGKITDDYAAWCLADKWESCMFWPNVKDMISNYWGICLPLTSSAIAWACLIVLLIMFASRQNSQLR